MKFGLPMVFNVKFIQVEMEEYLSAQMIGNLGIMLVQEVNDLELGSLIGDEFENLADKKVENSFRIVLSVDFNNLILRVVDQLMSCQPVALVPDTLDEILDYILVVDSR
jgi:hypothetical protein